MKRVLIASDIVNPSRSGEIFPRLKKLKSGGGVCFSICETAISEEMESFTREERDEKFSELRTLLIGFGVDHVLKHIGEPLLRDFSGEIVKEEFVAWGDVRLDVRDNLCGDFYENFSRKRNRAYAAREKCSSGELGECLKEFLNEDFPKKWYPEEIRTRKISTLEGYFDAVVDFWWFDTIVENSIMCERVKNALASSPLSSEVLFALKKKIVEEDRLNSELSKRVWCEKKILFDDVSSCKPVSVYYRSLRSLVRQILSAASVRFVEKKNLINLPEYMVQMRNKDVLLTENRGIVRTMFNEVFSEVREKRIMTLSELEVEMA